MGNMVVTFAVTMGRLVVLRALSVSVEVYAAHQSLSAVKY